MNNRQIAKMASVLIWLSEIAKNPENHFKRIHVEGEYPDKTPFVLMNDLNALLKLNKSVTVKNEGPFFWVSSWIGGVQFSVAIWTADKHEIAAANLPLPKFDEQITVERE